MTRYKAIGLVEENRKIKESIGDFFLSSFIFVFRLLETETNQEPVSELKKIASSGRNSPYNAIGLVQENFKVRYGSIKKIDRDLKLFFPLLETKFNQAFSSAFFKLNIDLSKCFDVIDHSKLLSKLSAHGIDTSWFSAYLQNHTQSVSLTDALGNVKISAKLPNNIGVFQGSALGPLLYCVFSNDLSLFTEDAVVVQYADDTQILTSGPKSNFQNKTSRMEAVLASLDVWFRANGLKVNAEKNSADVARKPA